MDSNYKVGDLIYDGHIYDGMNTDLSDLPFYKRWLATKKEGRILELCCGTGRLTIPLAQEGHKLVGLDHTPSMLKIARAKAAQAGLSGEFIEADMRTFDLAEKFELIFIPFNSIHHLYRNEDLFRTLQTVKNHLKEGAILIFDCFNPNIQLIVEGEKEQKQIAEYTSPDGREVVIKQHMRYEKTTQINRIAWHFFINGAFDSIQNLDMRMYYPQELDSYLTWNGFTILHKFGSFQEAAFQEDSDKQIYICQRAG